MDKKNRILELLKIKFPIIQAGMIWCSGWELASAVSNSGGLGLLGAGSMYPDILESQIKKCRSATNQPFGVNIPLLYPDIKDVINIILKEKINIVFTSAGNPSTWTPLLKENGITVVHVVSNSKFALKAESAGVDAIVAEGFEAGGHNGREETTTLCLIPMIRKITSLPLIAAGGISSGRTFLAARILGADAVQIGSRFAASVESSAHPAFKKKIIEAGEGDTMVTLKELTPVRLIKNHFFSMVKEAEERGASKEELTNILGRSRAKKGMFEGDLDNGELEIGQVSAMIDKVLPASEIMKEIILEYNELKSQLSEIDLKL